MAAWSCDACAFRNDDDALAACTVCNAVRVLTCPKCRKDIKCVLCVAMQRYVLLTTGAVERVYIYVYVCVCMR